MKNNLMSLLIKKEFVEAVRSRWLVGFVIAFCFLSVIVSWAGASSAAMGGYSGFGRMSAALINLILLVVPLMGIAAGALSIAGERERGTLELLLTLPARPGDIFIAKVIGLGCALALSLLIAFAFAAAILAFYGGFQDISIYLNCFFAALLLSGISLGFGFLISAVTRRVVLAIGATLLLWLILVFAGDLGLLGTSLAVKLGPVTLLASAWLNPLSLYRLLALSCLRVPLEMLGPAGLCAQDTLGPWLDGAVVAGLLTWMAASFGGAYIFYRRDPLRG